MIFFHLWTGVLDVGVHLGGEGETVRLLGLAVAGAGVQRVEAAGLLQTEILVLLVQDDEEVR